MFIFMLEHDKTDMNDPFDQFMDLIGNYVKLDADERAFLQEHIPMVQYSKGDMILTEGKVARTIYFVVQGCVRLFYNSNGNDRTAFFYTEGKFICAGESYTFDVPAKENFQALEDSVIMHFSKDLNEKLLAHSPKFEVLARIATEDELITCQRVIASFVSKSAEERYIELMEQHAEIFQRVPQQYIASYLGVSPETLSRIKKRVFQKKHS